MGITVSGRVSVTAPWQRTQSPFGGDHVARVRRSGGAHGRAPRSRARRSRRGSPGRDASRAASGGTAGNRRRSGMCSGPVSPVSSTPRWHSRQPTPFRRARGARRDATLGWRRIPSTLAHAASASASTMSSVNASERRLMASPARRRAARAHRSRTGAGASMTPPTAAATSQPSRDRHERAVRPHGHAAPRPSGWSGTTISISSEYLKPPPSGITAMAARARPLRPGHVRTTQLEPEAARRRDCRVSALRAPTRCRPGLPPRSCPAPLASKSSLGAARHRTVPPTVCEGKSPSTEKSDVAGSRRPGESCDPKSSKRQSSTLSAAEARASAMPGVGHVVRGEAREVEPLTGVEGRVGAYLLTGDVAALTPLHVGEARAFPRQRPSAAMRPPASQS